MMRSEIELLDEVLDPLPPEIVAGGLRELLEGLLQFGLADAPGLDDRLHVILVQLSRGLVLQFDEVPGELLQI
jgi:hypothetical protein